MADRVLDDLASAVVDREAVDWPAAQTLLATPEDARLASALSTISRISPSDPVARTRSSGRRLPPLLAAARALAILCVAAGVWGHPQAVAAGVRNAPVLLAMMLAFTAAAVMLDVGGRDRRASALAACYWTVAASFSIDGILWLSAQSPPAWLWRTLVPIRPESFFAACLWQFAREFPTLTRFSRLDVMCSIGVRGSLLLGVALFVVNLIPWIAPGSFLAELAAPLQRLGNNGPVFWLLVFGAALPALATMALRARHAVGEEAQRTRLFLCAFVVLFGPVVLEVLAESLSPSFARFMSTPSPRWWGGLLIYSTQLALPLVTAYAVVVGSVLEFRVVIQQGLRYLLARAVVMWGAAAPLALLGIYVYRRRAEPLASSLGSLEGQMLLAAAAAALLLAAVRTKLLRALDAWALPGVQAATTMLARMSERMNETRTPIEVAAVLAKAAEGALQARVHAYVARSEHLVPLDPSDAGVPPRSVLPVLLEGARGPCVVGPRQRHTYYNLVTPEDREWIDRHGIEVLAPVTAGRARGGVVAAIALEARRNALRFSPDDLRFLTAACAAAGLVYDTLPLDGPPAAGRVVDAEELATQCSQCRRIELWQPGTRVCACGGEWESAALPKSLLGRFELREWLGAGGMGVVYRATDLTLQRDVAVKSLTRLNTESADRLLDEARAMAALSHGHIAVLYGTETWRATPLLLMEYLGGGTLAMRLRRGALTVGAALDVARPLAIALEHVHRSGLMHGDIKPSNIGFTKEGVPKFLDFGLSRALGGELTGPQGVSTREAFIAGTPAYLSPEVRAGAPPGPALDLWALSLVLCEIVVGRHPLPGARTPAEWSRAVSRSLAHLESEGGRALREFLLAALSPSPQLRPRNAADLLREMDRIARAAGSST